MLDLPSRDQLLDYLLSFNNVYDQMGRPGEGQVYLKSHLDRLIKTIQLLPRLKGKVRVLELGASPYFMTILIQKYLGYEVTPNNFYRDYGEPAENWEREAVTTSDRFGETYTFRFKQFNVELDPFPYADGSFDIVLCCELIEHLLVDPSHMLKEIHRVLKPGGVIFISTPNVARLENVFRLIHNRNIFHPYSGYGPYGRHNREYTANELAILLKMHNFVPKNIKVDNVYHSPPWLTTLIPLQRWRDCIFILGQKTNHPVQCYPNFLYANQSSRRRITRNMIDMVDDDVSPLGSGWYDLENWPQPVRWTGREATAFFVPNGEERVFGFRAVAGPLRTSGKIRINGQEAGAFSINPHECRDVLIPLPDTIKVGIKTGRVPRIEIQIYIQKIFIPARDIPGSKDKRRLGIAVEKLWLS